MKLSRRQFLLLGGSTVLLPNLLPEMLAAAPAGSVPVLMYHDITEKYRDPYSTPPSLFAAHMEWLFSQGYRAISLADAAGAQRGGDRNVVLTFDDGYASFLDYAFPLLAEYRFKATLNLIAGYAGRHLDYLGPRSILSWDECRYMAESGMVDLGCHTSSLHEGRGVLDASPERLESDLIAFRREMREKTGRDTEIMAWPYGKFNEESIAVAERVGFRYFLTSEEGIFIPSGNFRVIPRLNMTGALGMDGFRERL